MTLPKQLEEVSVLSLVLFSKEALTGLVNCWKSAFVPLERLWGESEPGKLQISDLPIERKT